MPAAAVSLDPPRDGQRWLVKPRLSAAGLGVRHWKPHEPAATGNVSTRGSKQAVYYQQYIPGPVYSSLYLAAQNNAVLLGASRQWTGARQLGARQFLYCGSITANRLPVSRQRLERLGQVLANEFSLIGLFGVDWVLAEGEIWPLEVNPRYTASCELVERQLDCPLVAWHVQACRDQRLPATYDGPPSSSHRQAANRAVLGKGILYATSRVQIHESFHDWVRKLNDGQAWPRIADIPAISEVIEQRQPIVTLFAEGRDAREVKRRILELAIVVRRCLAG
jgi:predicted ATP-grasp superfamily ATP-dependent carboligase